jgi:glycosyltransferase involved in cell wall biosynthesis
MHVGFEVIAAGSGLGEGQGGASGYIEGLLPELLADPRVDRITAYVADWYPPAADWSDPKLTVRRLRVPTQRPGRVAYEQLALPLHARRDGIDVLFSTGNFRPLTYRAPNVLALHAVQHFLLGDDIGRLRSSYVRFAVPRSARTADLVVAVTDALRTDAIRLFDLDPERIVSVPMGPSPWVLELLESMTSVEPYKTADGSPYVLCISRLYALKNHRRMIEAFAQLVHEQKLPHKFVIVGGDADVTQAELAQVAAQERISDRVLFLGRVPQVDVPGLYAGADAIAYASLYETFATGTPLVTSTTGGTAEVSGGAAELVDPREVDDIARGLSAVLTDAELRERLSAAGRRRVLDFTWERCARGSLDAMAEAIRRRN